MSKYLIVGACFSLATACVFSCGDKAANNFGAFDIYGRVVYRPPFVGSVAEFFIYHDGLAADDALILVESDTIPLVIPSRGYYSKALAFEMGDTLGCSVQSQYGTWSGILVIPDTTEIVEPAWNDTVYYGVDLAVTWREELSADGYYVLFEDQAGGMTAVKETRIDTSVMLPGTEIASGGNKILWVEALRGDVVGSITPNARILPLGVLASAANYRQVYVSLSRQSNSKIRQDGTIR